MLHAPVNEAKSQDGQAKRQVSPLPERERYPLSVETPGHPSLTGNGSGSILPSAVARSRSPAESLQRLYGNQAVLQMRNGSGGPPAPLVPLRPSQSGLLQRKCACGGAAGMSGECEECGKEKRFGLQTKLKVNEPGDSYEREADRIADQVMATPAHHAVSGAPPHIQRFSGQSNRQMEAVPASVDQALAGPGRPLESATRAFFEPRFGRDFSHVRVHTDTRADEAARDIHAHAFTAAHHVVFAAGRYAPQTESGRSLLAHELTHVVQQGGEGDLIQRAPANYPSNDPIAAQTGPTPDSSAKKSKPQLTPDDWIWILENFRRQSPQEFVKFLAANEGFFYPILKPHGFRGSWTKDQAYLDDFDAAIVKWGKSHIYSLRFANISQTVSQQKPKSREERKYEYAQYLVRDMNRHGYSRGKVNDELESYGLMDDLVSHGFEKHDKWSFKNHEEYKNEAIVALNAYIDRYDAVHGNKRQTSANVPTQGEDVEFYRAWLEGLGYVTSSFFAAAFANTASKFTSDPKKITAAAGAGAAFEGVVFSVAGALGGGGSYRPEVVGPRDRPAAVAPWRYTGKQPIKPVVDPAKVGASPAPALGPTQPPMQIADTQVVIALDRANQGLPLNDIQKLIVRTVRAEDLKVAHNVDFELKEGGGTKTQFEIAGPVNPKTRIERKAIMDQLQKAGVGKEGGTKDQLIVRQVLLTESVSGRPPIFVTSDGPMINGLARLAKILPEGGWGKYQNAAEYLKYEKGATTFDVVVEGRKMTVRPIQPVRESM